MTGQAINITYSCVEGWMDGFVETGIQILILIMRGSRWFNMIGNHFTQPAAVSWKRKLIQKSISLSVVVSFASPTYSRSAKKERLIHNREKQGAVIIYLSVERIHDDCRTVLCFNASYALLFLSNNSWTRKTHRLCCSIVD